MIDALLLFVRKGPPPVTPQHLSLALLLSASLLSPPLAAGCVSTPAGLRLSSVGEQLALTAARVACAQEAAVPVVGSELVLACPLEVAGLQAGLDQVTAQAAPVVPQVLAVDAGAPAPARCAQGAAAGRSGAGFQVRVFLLEQILALLPGVRYDAGLQHAIAVRARACLATRWNQGGTSLNT